MLYGEQQPIKEDAMKKMIIVTTLIATILLSTICFATGNVTVTDKTACIYAGDDSGYFYAKVENDGDKPVGVDNGKLVLFSGNDDILVTSDYVNTYPSRIILNPGEYTYISEFLWDSNLKNQTIGDVKFSIDTTDRGTEAERIPCEASYEINGSDSHDNRIYVTLTNDSDETRYGYYVIAALLDTAGNLVYVNTNRLESVGLHPGSTATFSLYMDSDSINYLEQNGIQIGSVDAIVYYREE